MDGPTANREEANRAGPLEGVSSRDRTLVIVLAQVVAIVALLVLWSTVRACRCGKPANG
jgi:hypothetical protein